MKKLLSILMAALMMMSLAACSTQPAASAPAPAEPAAPAAPAGDSAASDAPAPVAEGAWSREFEGESLTFLDVSPSDTRTAYFEGLFERFYADTGIEVEYQSVPWDDAADKLTVLGASNSLPDVMTMWSGWLGQFTQSGWVVPLSQYIGGTEDEYTAAVTDIIWESEKTRYGDIYTVPDGMMVKGVFVRKDWCEEKGITLDPAAGWTYDEYFALVEQLTDAANGRYGSSYRGARGALDPCWVYMQGYTEGATFNQEGKINMTSDECLAAFEKWTNVYLNGWAPEDSINWGFTEMVDNFKGGLTGTLINDSEVAATLIAGMEDSQWMVMPMPRSEKDGIIYNMINSPYAYSISGHSENPDASWLLIQYLTDAANQAEYCEITGMIPIKKAASDLELYSADGYYGVFLQQLNDPTVAVPTTFGAFDFTDLHQGLLHEEVQSYLLGDQSSAEALGNICTALQERMDEYMAENPGAGIEVALTMSKD